jgi:glucose/arabinose dehydrogenase
MRLRAMTATLAAAVALTACGTATSFEAEAAPVPASVLTKGPPVAVSGAVSTGLTSPWGLAYLPDGSALVSERDTGLVKRIAAAGGPGVVVGRVKGAIPTGEGGLLGLAVPPGPNPTYVFAYYTGARDNRVVRISWDGSRLGRQTPILTGIPKNTYHDGGRLLVGPEDTLFVGTGDAGEPSLSQDRRSLGGKVLRITFDGKPAPGNPFRGSPVYTLGHRNVQGLAFDSAGRLWASEFGQNDADELNLLRPGANYGWPVHEGASSDTRYVNPVVQWSPTSVASPSGITILDDIVYVASLRGEVLWQVRLAGAKAAKPVALDLGDLGRLRTVAASPDGGLWLVTSNTDGRGSPRAKDDRIVRLTVG